MDAIVLYSDPWVGTYKDPDINPIVPSPRHSDLYLNFSQIQTWFHTHHVWNWISSNRFATLPFSFSSKTNKAFIHSQAKKEKKDP